MPRRQAFQHSVGILAEDFFVLMQQRLTFGRVDHHGVGLAGQFHMGRKPGPSGAYHTRRGHRIKCNLRHEILKAEPLNPDSIA